MKPKKVVYVSELEIMKSIVKMSLHELKTGTLTDYKIWTKKFNRMPFVQGDFLYLDSVSERPQQAPTGEVDDEGKRIYRDVEGTVEYWLDKYRIITDKYNK
jgi:hypothetical protein